MKLIFGLILMPLLMLAAFAAVIFVPMLPLLVVALARDVRRAYRRHRRLCDTCGYDLRGSRGAGACPECGRRIRELHYPAHWPDIHAEAP